MALESSALVLDGGDLTLQAFLQGLALILGLIFHQADGLLEIDNLMARHRNGIVILVDDEPGVDHFRVTSRLSAQDGIYVILIGEAYSEELARQAVMSGAITYLGRRFVIESLTTLIATLKRCFPDDAHRRRIIPLGNNVTLCVPDLIISDGHQQTCLRMIPGRLLQYLSEHAGTIVPFHELIQAAWEDTAAATANTLWQHIHVLREVLALYDLRNRLRSVRGRGYVYDLEASVEGSQEGGKDKRQQAPWPILKRI